MHIEILSIGSEILCGRTLNTNAAFLSRELHQRGFLVKRHLAVADEPHAIREAVQEAMHRSTLVIATGGLGPTLDDITQANVKQLYIGEPLSLKNSIGAALGSFYLLTGAKTGQTGNQTRETKGLILLPGVPREMERMFLDEALPLIKEHFVPQKGFTHSFSLCFFDEREIDPYLRDFQAENPEIEVGIYPAAATLQIVLRAKIPVEAFGKALEAKFPNYVFPERRIEEAVHRELMARQKTLGLAESCTGGSIAARLTALEGASYFLLGSIVAYSNAWKETFLRVPPKTLTSHGAVSRETVQAMAEGIFATSEADYVIAVSGIAGPAGGTKEKPVGTVYIAVGKRGGRLDIGKIQAPAGDRLAVIDFTVQTALCALWRRLVHNETTFS